MSAPTRVRESGGRETTPLMQQYREIKSRHRDAILLFRMGDFYETFEDDAEVASRVLGITLTSRNNGGAGDVPLAGIPVRALDEYLRRLVRAGHRVAICEQIEDPKVAKGIVRREVVETVTPGAAFHDELLDGARNNFLCALNVERAPRAGETRAGVAAADVTTGELRLFVVPVTELDALLARLEPREMIRPRGEVLQLPLVPAQPSSTLVTERETWEFDPAMARDDLTRHFALRDLEGLGIGADDDIAVGAAGALLRYLRELQPAGLPQIGRPVVERVGGVMPLDEMTRRNLEIVESLRGGGEGGTLLETLDRTLTPMGRRLLRQWLLAPLVNASAINSRLDAVEALFTDSMARDALRSALEGVRDLERLAGKAAAARANPRELRALGDSLARVPEVEQALMRLGARARAGILDEIAAAWDACADVSSLLQALLVARPPSSYGDEDTVAPGADRELDELRALRDGGRDAIAMIQRDERERTGISSLKVGYNRVFGYFIAVTNSNLHLVPPHYQRRQTLAGEERFVTPDLKEYEARVLGAAERIEQRERELVEQARTRAGAEIRRLQCLSRAIAQLDVLAALADAAAREGYVRPSITDGFELEIVGGRHPVVERMMPRERFIPNDVRLVDDARVIVLTGPNMAGKSTVLRQVGLLVLMAQVGSFVPASSATVGVTDRLFTRVGASDNLVRGQSTFMVEMSETSAILHTATARSLVLLDEIGRGTSTYDGVSIAWAVTEHLHDRVGCKTIFATHYHELTGLADELKGVRNFTVAVREVDGRVLFLHRLVPGGADRSYGIEVGRLAGLPDGVIARAQEVLRLLEAAAIADRLTGTESPPARASSSAEQLGLFAHTPHPVLAKLQSIDPNAMTPMQALALLAELRDAASRA